MGKHVMWILSLVGILFCSSFETRAMDVQPQERIRNMALLRSLILKKIPPKKKVIQSAICDNREITHMQFSPDGKFLVEIQQKDTKNTVVITDFIHDKRSYCSPQDGYVGALAVSNQKIITGYLCNKKQSLLMWDLYKGTLLKNVSKNITKKDKDVVFIGSVVWHPRSFDFISVPMKDTFFVHDNCGTIKAHCEQKQLNAVSYSPCGNSFVSVCDEAIILRDSDTGGIKGQIALGALAVAWNPKGGVFVAVSNEAQDNVIVCNGITGELISYYTDELQRRDGYYVERDIYFSSNGKYIVTVSDTYFDRDSNTIIIRDAVTFKILDHFIIPCVRNTVDISYDGQYLIFGIKIPKNNIILYDLELHKIVQVFTAIIPRIIRWRPNNYQFVSAPVKGCSLTVWNLFDVTTKEALDDLESNTIDLQLLSGIFHGKI